MHGKCEGGNILAMTASFVNSEGSSPSHNIHRQEQRCSIDQQVDPMETNGNQFIHTDCNYFADLTDLSSQPISGSEEEGSDSDEEVQTNHDYIKGHETCCNQFTQPNSRSKEISGAESVEDTSRSGLEYSQSLGIEESRFTKGQHLDTTRLIEQMSIFKQQELQNYLDLAALSAKCANKGIENRQLHGYISKMNATTIERAKEMETNLRELDSIFNTLTGQVSCFKNVDSLLNVARENLQPDMNQESPIAHYREESIRYLQRIAIMEHENNRLCGLVANIGNWQTAETQKQSILESQLYEYQRHIELLRGRMDTLYDDIVHLNEMKGVSIARLEELDETRRRVDKESRNQIKSTEKVTKYLKKLQRVLEACEESE